MLKNEIEFVNDVRMMVANYGEFVRGCRAVADNPSADEIRINASMSLIAHTKEHFPQYDTIAFMCFASKMYEMKQYVDAMVAMDDEFCDAHRKLYSLFEKDLKESVEYVQFLGFNIGIITEIFNY